MSNARNIAALLPAFILWVALPAHAQRWPMVSGWVTVQTETGCATGTEYQGRGEALFVIIARTDGSLFVTVTKGGWSTTEDRHFDLSVELDGRVYDAAGYENAVKEGRGGFRFSIDERFLGVIARASSIAFRREETTLESLSLDGSGAAIQVLRRCLAHAKATRTPEQREKDRSTIIPEDPFAREQLGGSLPTPGSAVSSRKLIPRGSPQSWITNDDYPAGALREEKQGTTGFQLDVDASGRVTNCTVTVSSGSTDLDSTACSLLKRRARFTPAIDAKGLAVPSSWESRFRWELPKD